MTPLQQLKEDYDRRLRTILDEIDHREGNCSKTTLARLDAKARLYREFAYELGKLMPEENQEDEECRCCGSIEGMGGEDELCDNCFTNDPNED